MVRPCSSVPSSPSPHSVAPYRPHRRPTLASVYSPLLSSTTSLAPHLSRLLNSSQLDLHRRLRRGPNVLDATVRSILYML